MFHKSLQRKSIVASNVFQKSYLLQDKVEKHGKARQATDDNITRRMRLACWITKAKNTNSKYTGRFIMFSVITNNYYKKTKGPTLMELFTATGKLKKFFFYN